MFYSPSNNSFYDPRLEGRYRAAGTWPPDLVSISPEDHATFRGAPPDGKSLAAGPDGRPAWVDAPRFSSAEQAERALVGRIDAATRQIIGLIPDDEKTSWPVKAMAAQAYKAGTADSDQTAMLTAEAEKTGEAIDALADLIVARASAYTAAIAPLTGIRRAAQRDLTAAADAAELEQIVDAAAAEIDATLAAALAAQQG